MKRLVFLLNLFTLSAASAAPLCARWSAPKQIGELDVSVLPEASGLAISPQFPNRLYHVGDAGNALTIFQTDFSGRTEAHIPLKGVSPQGADIEELGYGPCGNGERCVFVGNIGDNDLARRTVQVLWFREEREAKETPSFLGHLTLKYPDHAHNAEALVVHPQTGDLFIFTKEAGKDGSGNPTPAKIFRVPGDVIRKGGEATATLEPFGEFNVPSVLEDIKKKGRIVTGASVASTGDRLLLLTYRAVIEFAWDFRAPPKAFSRMKSGVDYLRHDFDELQQQEAIAYLPDDSGFLVTTEGKKTGDAPIVQVNCLN